MNRRRLGQLLIAGVFAACAAAISGLIELVKKEETKPASAAKDEAGFGTEQDQNHRE